MSTAHEKATNDKYMFRYKDDNSDDIITFKTNLIKKIQEHDKEKNTNNIQGFSPKSVTADRFDEFLKYANDAGYTIYKVIEL